jgi:Ni/Co efflux regulator RcnB
MNSKRSLMTALVGLAMLATPIAAAAHDYNHYDHATHAARVAAAVNATHPYANHVYGNGAFARHERHEERAIADANAYRNYGRGYGYAAPAYAAPVYAAPAYATPGYAAAPYYGGGYGGGNGCRRAQSVMTNYYKDRNTGHPAAAYDLLRQNQWALNSGCASGAPVMGSSPLGGLFSGLGGYGRPAYNTGYAQQGYGYAQQGYGQPYGGGSMLAPLLGQFGIR